MSATYPLSIAALILASVLSSTAWILEGEAVLRLHPLPVTCVSNLLGGFILLGFARSRSAPPPTAQLRESLGSFLSLVLARNVIGTFLFATCLTMTSSSKVMFLTKIEPYLVLFLHWLIFRNRIGAGQFALLAVHVAGAVLLSTGGHLDFSASLMGDVLVLTGVTLNALTYDPAQRIARSYGALWASGLSQLAGGVILLPFTLWFTSGYFSMQPPYDVGWAYALATVMVFYVISSALWFYSLRDLPPWLSSALRCVGPVIAAPVAFFAFDQRLSTLQVMGAAVVVLTSVWMVILERPKSPVAATT